MEENYVWFWKLFTGLFWYANVVVLVKGSVYQPNLVATYHLLQLLFRFQQFIMFTLIALKTNFYSAVILEKFDLILAWIACIFNLFEKMLTVEPNHLDRIQLHWNFFPFLLRHTHYYLIANSQLLKKHLHFYTQSSFSEPLLWRLFISTLCSPL